MGTDDEPEEAAEGAGRAGDPGGGRASVRSRVLLGLVSLAVTLGVGFGLLELFLRACLFAPDLVGRDLVRRFAVPRRYASTADEDFWKLRELLKSGDEGIRGRPHSDHDPLLGWRSRALGADLRHRWMPLVGKRRPLLMYGDSFTNCVTPPEDCWEGLVAASDLAEEFVVLNHGVGGYGIDQMLLLARETLPLYAHRRPLVIVGVFVESDLPRAMTGLRSWPKPRFQLEDGELVLRPAGEADPGAYVRRHPVEITSYAWRWLIRGDGWPRALGGSLHAEAAWIDRQRELNHRLIEALRDELAAHGLDAFFVLFNGTEGCRDDDLWGWEEPFLHASLAELGIPFVSTRPDLREDARRTGRALEDYFVFEASSASGHYSALGNEVAFRALRAGLDGRFERAGEVLVLEAPR